MRALLTVARDYAPARSAKKLRLLRALERNALRRADEVLALHETLVFLAAHPDDARVLRAVLRMLRGFPRRPDLQRHARRLADSGIAGTATTYRFFAAMAMWLAARWPERLTIDWDGLDDTSGLDKLLPLLAHPAELPGLDEYDLGARAWIDLMRGRRETDALFVIRRLAELPASDELHETIADGLDLPFRLAPGPGGPSRTPTRVAPRIHFQREPLDRARPDLAREARRPPRSIRNVPAREAERLIDLAREAMASRSRDLDAFAHADASDVRLVTFERGLSFAAFGVVPERRLLLETVYGFLTLRNGVPTGYVLTAALFGSCEVAYNVFETFRDGESAWVYGRIAAMTAKLFGADTLMIPPYQLGYDNDEGIQTGAWWFYRKLGFEPRAAAVQRLEARERAAMERAAGHRSTPATLRRLASEPMFLHLGARRSDVLGSLPLANIGLAVTRMLAKDYGSDRDRAEDDLAADAARALGVRSFRGWSAGECEAWTRWAPLVKLALAQGHWTPDDRRALVEVIRAKGGRRESEFVRVFDGHAPLRRAVRRIAEKNAPAE